MRIPDERYTLNLNLNFHLPYSRHHHPLANMRLAVVALNR